MECEGGVCRRSPRAPGNQVTLWLYDAAAHNLALRWHKIPNALRYELQYRVLGDKEWAVASNKLQSNTVKKRGLQPSTTYEFRLRSRDEVDWNDFSAPVQLLTLAEDALQPSVPSFKDAGGSDFVVSWDAQPHAERYEIQFCQGDGEWVTSSSKLRGTSCRKGNLHPGLPYEARVRGLIDGRWGSFSPPSVPMSAAVLADCWTRNVGRSLITCSKEAVPTQALAGSTYLTTYY